MTLEDWEVQVGFKNLPVYKIPWSSFDYTSAASDAGQFKLTVPLTGENMDLLRGSMLSFLYKGEKRFTGKIIDKVPNFDQGYIILTGLDWNGLLFDRQISFQGYDDSVYSYDRTDYWDWSYAEPPGENIVMEGSALMKLMLRTYMGKDINDYFFDLSNMEGSINQHKWRFEGESIGESFSKVASVMQSSNIRFGYNWWVDPYDKFWLKRYGDSIYRKPLAASWGPPSEDSSSVINDLHLVGGIATPFPDDRSKITDIGTFSITAYANGSANHEPPTAGSEGWGCWISPRTNISTGAEDSIGGHKIVFKSETSKGHVSGNLENALTVTMSNSASASYGHSMGIYYQIDNANGAFYNRPDLRDWSDRNDITDRVSHQIRTITMYLRMATDDYYGWDGSGMFKLKVYTQEPTFVTNDNYPDTQNSNYVREETEKLYEVDLSEIVNNYLLENQNYSETGDQSKWLRLVLVFDKAIDTAVDGSHAGSGLQTAPGTADGDFAGVATYDVTWNVFSGEEPAPTDIWGFGLEMCMRPPSATYDSWLAIDHLFFGFGEIEVQRRDSIAIAALDREVTRWVHDRHCHSWERATHLAEALLDALSYAQKSRTGRLDYFNPELRLNQLLPVNEYGVEWMYVIDSLAVSVSESGVTQTINVGTPRPTADELMNFYQVEMKSVESAGSGKTVHDWVANTKCYARCELFCEFACLSDWSSTYRKGGSVCQTSREISCVTCESVSELNPCITACLKYSEIATIAQIPPAERSAVESTLLSMGTKASAVKYEGPPVAIRDDIRCHRLKAGAELT